MPNMQRTPPKSPKTPKPGQSQSVPDIASALSSEHSNMNVTVRAKRQRIDDSPNNPILPSCTCGEWRSELMELMTAWKSECDLRLSAWKAEHDAMLSTLVKEVSEIKNHCAAILKTTYEPKVNVSHSNKDHLKVKGKDLEKRPKSFQDSQLQSRPVTVQLPIVLATDSGTEIAPTEVMSEKGNVEDLSTCEMSMDILHSSGEQATSSPTRRVPKPRVSVSVPTPIMGGAMGDMVSDGPGKEGWTEVRHRRSRRSLGNVLRGTAAPGVTCLEASERWRYLHLFYVKQGTTESQVREHLSAICRTDVCTVEVLKPRGKYASFKLGVPSKLAEQVMAAQNWAEDICVKPWRRNFRGHSEAAQ